MNCRKCQVSFDYLDLNLLTFKTQTFFTFWANPAQKQEKIRKVIQNNSSGYQVTHLQSSWKLKFQNAKNRILVVLIRLKQRNHDNKKKTSRFVSTDAFQCCRWNASGMTIPLFLFPVANNHCRWHLKRVINKFQVVTKKPWIFWVMKYPGSCSHNLLNVLKT